MWRTSILFVCACAAASPAHADRPGQFQSASGSLRIGVTVQCETTIEPPLKTSEILLLGGGVQMDKDRMHRFLVDKATQSYFGYDLVVGPADAPNRYRVTIEPLNISMARLRPISGDTPLKTELLRQYPAPQVVEAGDTIVLDLLVSPNGRQKVVDYIEILTGISPQPSTSTATPKDFTLDDGPVTFDAQGKAAFFVSGKPWPEILGLTKKNGSTFWLCFPGRGRYVLSLVPHEGYNFQRTGVIRDNVISFQSEGDQYELRLSKAIVGSGGAWNLYVLHDPLYQPPNGSARIVGVGTDRLENLLPKR